MENYNTNQGKREDVPTDSNEIQKNVQGQGQREQGEDAQDEFLDNDLDDKARNMDENEDKKSHNEKDIIRKWEEIRHYFMMKNSDLTEVDVTHGENDGDFDKMLERIGKKSGKNKDQIRREIIDYDEKN